MLDRLLIFDFDGVVADSEFLANRVGAASLTALGLPTTTEQHLDRYMGKSWSDYFAALAVDLGRPLPPDYAAAHRAELDGAEHEVQAVAGIGAFIARYPDIPRCVASSNDLAYLHRTLTRLGLAPAFGDNVFSAQQVARGKPFPDLFLFAAARLGVDSDRTLVIEDSPAGVRAGVAAGMTVLGLCAGAHCRPGHDSRLTEAGAHAVAADYEAAARFTDAWLAKLAESALSGRG